MKIFFFMGRNPKNKSGVSWKIWKIERKGRSVFLYWGRAELRRRKVLPAGRLAHRVKRFSTEQQAINYQQKRIAEKLAKGYERRTRWRD
jgi:hypothetical protein